MYTEIDDMADTVEEAEERLVAPCNDLVTALPDCDDCIDSYQFPRLFSVPNTLPIEESVFCFRSSTDALLSILRFGITTPDRGALIRSRLVSRGGEESLNMLARSLDCMTLYQGSSHGGCGHTITTRSRLCSEAIVRGEMHIVPEDSVLCDSVDTKKKTIDTVLLPTQIRCVMLRSADEIVQGIYRLIQSSVESYMRERFWNKEAEAMLCAPLWLLAGFCSDVDTHIIENVEVQAQGLVTFPKLFAEAKAAAFTLIDSFPCDSHDELAVLQYLQDQSGIRFHIQELQNI